MLYVMQPVKSPTLDYIANFATQGIGIGGKLIITDTTVKFEPNGLNKAFQRFGLNPSEASVIFPTNTIKSVTIQPPTYNWVDSGMRKRLRIDTADGRIYLFFINRLQARIQEVRQLAGIQSGSPLIANAFPDPSKDPVHRDAIAAAMGAPNKQQFKKILGLLFTFPIVGSIIGNLIGNAALAIMLGAVMPTFGYILSTSYVGIRSRISMYQVARETVSASATKTAIDSTSLGVNAPNMDAYRIVLQLKMIALALPYVFYCIIASGIIIGIFE